jgi:nucleoside-diphosphate-sugar epimerase
MVETIALFGGTGGTGSAFLKLALEAGYKVRALVRTPSKVSVGSNEHFLTVMQGSFDDTDKVEETIKGADYVVCMGGIPPSYVKGYPTDVMLNFVKKLYGLLERQTSAPKLFLYQVRCTIDLEKSTFLAHEDPTHI